MSDTWSDLARRAVRGRVCGRAVCGGVRKPGLHGGGEASPAARGIASKCGASPNLRRESPDVLTRYSTHGLAVSSGEGLAWQKSVAKKRRTWMSLKRRKRTFRDTLAEPGLAPVVSVETVCDPRGPVPCGDSRRSSAPSSLGEGGRAGHASSLRPSGSTARAATFVTPDTRRIFLS